MRVKRRDTEIRSKIGGLKSRSLATLGMTTTACGEQGAHGSWLGMRRSGWLLALEAL
jgi:hypothetical protein